MTLPAGFHNLSLTTVGLRTPSLIRDPEVVLKTFPVTLLPQDFGPSSSTLPLTYLDSTASTQMILPAHQAWEEALQHYANTHSRSYDSARRSSRTYEKAHQTVLDFVHADPTTHVAIFVGHGATGAINRLARSLFPAGETPDRGVVLTTEMEHHANLLPWRTRAPRTESIPVDPLRGTLNMEALETALRRHAGQVRLVAATGVSNVTGIVNDVALIARLAHEYGAEVLIDAAQTAPHRQIDMKKDGIDHLVFSGHKIYAPGSPGVLVTSKASLPAMPDETGGGVVRSVDGRNHVFTDKFPDREEAGTPDILGAASLAGALRCLSDLGMDAVWEHEAALTDLLLAGLGVFSEIRIYGDVDVRRTPRCGVVAFNIEGLHRTIAAQALSDYFNIAVRAGRFCSYPYADALLAESGSERGMLRASLGVYSTGEDVQRFHHAIDWIVENRDRLAEEYTVTREGDAIRRDGWSLE